MTRVFAFFVANWRFSAVLTAGLIVLGLTGTRFLQREAFPPVNFARVTVTTIFPGASPEEVQDKVTRVIEEELRGIQGIKDVRSISQNERSQIDIRVDIDRGDSDRIVNDIQRAVQRASGQLPPELPEAPLVSEQKAREIPIMEVAIVGSNEGRGRDRLAIRLKEMLEDVAGVANVRLSGFREREIQVLLNRERLSQSSLGLTDVLWALRERIKNIPAGYVEDGTQVTLVRVVGQTSLIEEIEAMTVRSNDGGQAVRVKDVGRVVEGAERARNLARLDGEEATLLVATKKPDADALEMVEDVRTKLASFEKTLPAGYRLAIYNDEGRRIENRLKIVTFNAVFGLVAVLLVLFLFLPGKVGLASAASLPICALATIACMVFLGANFNIITMIALVICLGNLVDNSVVISEFYTSLRERGEDAAVSATRAARQFWVPFTASTITIISAFLPMIVTNGVMGQFIRWIPIVVTIALVASLFEAVTLLPARLQFIHPTPKLNAGQNESDGTDWFARIEDAFGRFVDWTLQRRIATLAALTALVISGFVATALFNRFELFPAEGVEYYGGRFKAPAGTSLKRTDAYGATLSQEVIKALGKDHVAYVVARAGIQLIAPGDPQQKNGDNVGMLLVAIKPEIAPTLDIEATLRKLRSISKPDGLTELTFEAVQGGPPVGKPLTVTLRSSNERELEAVAARLKSELARVPGLLDVTDDIEDAGDEFRLRFNEALGAYAGVSLDAIGVNLRTALEGTPVAKLADSGREFEVRVKFEERDKSRIESLAAARIGNSRGNYVPLQAISAFELQKAPRTRRNYEFRRAITITGDVDLARLTSAEANAEARRIIETDIRPGPDIAVSFGGEEEATKESLQSLGLALVIAIFGIFATLVFTFSSLSKPLLILSTIPLGLIGVLYSFIVDQRPLSFLAFIGVVGLSGVVINSAIILVDYIEELRTAEKGSRKPRTTRDLLVLASRQRLRAVLATGLTTVVGLLPTAFGWGGDDPLLIPITLSLSWGMIVGTVLSLVWIPAGYLVLDELKHRLRPSRTAPDSPPHQVD